MRDLTRCNFCKHRDLVARATADGMVVDTVRASNGGVNAYVRGPGEKPDRRNPDDGNTQWKVWYMSLPEECHC